ncbi:MAG: hypothetical protein KDC91_06860 [Flavobacteriaceae bacterium]|nr:hypothetical protein [Flavobacteriaceae bacterium]
MSLPSNENPPVQEDLQKIKVLNFATFHMGSTSDASSVEFDEENKKNQQDAKQIAAMISAFKPTVICVEIPPAYNDELNEAYQAFLHNSNETSSYYGEIGLVAFEVGRLNHIEQLYGIDHKLDYNYLIDNDVVNTIDTTTYNAFKNNPLASIKDLDIQDVNLPLLEKLRRMNDPRFLNFLILVNADMLAFVGTEKGFEGADEAAKYYQRNLRIYSNLNRIPLTKNDRVFILSGGSHTAFLNEFMKRSPKYEVVNTLDYLK